MTQRTQRGGLRNPPGGRPPKPVGEKYVQISVKLPPHLLTWLNENTDNKNGFIVAAITKHIAGNTGRKDFE